MAAAVVMRHSTRLFGRCQRAAGPRRGVVAQLWVHKAFHLRSTRHTRDLLKLNAGDGLTATDDDYFDEDDPALCVIPLVSVNNAPELKFTELRLEVADYPGLLRVVSWVLNGMGMRVHNAALKTTDDGIAEDSFWLTDFAGRKLSDRAADALAERLTDYVHTCAPKRVVKNANEYKCGNVVVSNSAHDKYTEVTIKGEPGRIGFLLEIASVMTGIGLEIAEAEIKGEQGEEILPELEVHDYSTGRLFRFWVTDMSKQKLDFSRISALVYTLGLITGNGTAPTVPPNLDVLAQ